MHPALSILCFTTLAGAAQGLVVALALARLLSVPMAPGFLPAALLVAELLLLAGLAASFLHLGQKLRAWRAVLMWRTSWMSREVIALPAFIVLVALWYLAERARLGSVTHAVLPLLAILGAVALWYCTAMIYACLRFIEEWAHPLTIVNYTLIGLASGLLLASALAVLLDAGGDMIASNGSAALGVTVAAWITRNLALQRNAGIRHKSTLQSATGIRADALVQKSMGMSAGSFNTREFFHGASQVAMRHARLGLQLLAFALPILLMLWALTSRSHWPWVAAMLIQAPGLLVERWVFFAQAKHPQNLYYQTVS